MLFSLQDDCFALRAVVRHVADAYGARALDLLTPFGVMLDVEQTVLAISYML